MTQQRIAVVGSGISGNLAARLLHDSGRTVTVFEAGGHVGGHAETYEFEAFGRGYTVDTGFMVYNDRTYPNFVRVLDRLGVATRTSDMSFSVRHDRSNLEYQGGTMLGLFAQKRNLFRWRFWGMLREIMRFNRVATQTNIPASWTVREFLDRHQFGGWFRDCYFLPMAASIWSAVAESIYQFPAHFLLNFFRNHGLLQIRDRPCWKTIDGGSQRYVRKLAEPFWESIHLNCPVRSVQRRDQHVVVQTDQGESEFDAVVMATHADQTLEMLSDVDALETSVLQPIRYQSNEAVLHFDSSLLPRRKSAWASWNYFVPATGGRPVTLTYHLNQLQGHVSPEPILVTLNQTDWIDDEKIVARFHYQHPVFDAAAVNAQKRLSEINGHRRTYYCGAYWYHGFHEDGVRSALDVTNCFGLELENWKAASTTGACVT